MTCFFSPLTLRTSPSWRGSRRSTSKRAKFTSLFRPEPPCSPASTAPRSGKWTLTPENAGRTRWWAGRPRKEAPHNFQRSLDEQIYKSYLLNWKCSPVLLSFQFRRLNWLLKWVYICLTRCKNESLKAPLLCLFSVACGLQWSSNLGPSIFSPLFVSSSYKNWSLASCQANDISLERIRPAEGRTNTWLGSLSPMCPWWHHTGLHVLYQCLWKGSIGFTDFE